MIPSLISIERKIGIGVFLKGEIDRRKQSCSGIFR